MAAGEAVELLATGKPGLPEGFGPSEHASLRFSKDGQRLFLGTAARHRNRPRMRPSR